ncbi:MAG TPA: hypothetical protein VES88_12100 [Gemmatimonadaceae bacterium]|nr:hypothetical protein [Gemmatimonadaceae bacterium]
MTFPSPGQNNIWFRQGTADTVLVMTHGINSNSRDAWQLNGVPDAYWPLIIAKDSQFANVGIFLAGYPTSTRDTTSLVAAAAGMFTALSSVADSGGRSVVDRGTIIFVAHSLGGIVTRTVLRDNIAAFAYKNIGLILYSSPHLGSRLADLAVKLGYARGKLYKVLNRDNEILLFLDKETRLELKDVRWSIAGASACESDDTRLFLVSMRVVDRDKCSNYFGKPTVIPHTDHFAVVKPRDEGAAPHKILKQVVQDSITPIVNRNGRIMLTARVTISAEADTMVESPEVIADTAFITTCQTSSAFRISPRIHRGMPTIRWDSTSYRSVLSLTTDRGIITISKPEEIGDSAITIEGVINVPLPDTTSTCAARSMLVINGRLFARGWHRIALPVVQQSDLVLGRRSACVTSPSPSNRLPAKFRNPQWHYTVDLSGFTGKANIQATLSDQHSSASQLVSSFSGTGMGAVEINAGLIWPPPTGIPVRCG